MAGKPYGSDDYDQWLRRQPVGALIEKSMIERVFGLSPRRASACIARWRDAGMVERAEVRHQIHYHRVLPAAREDAA